MLAIDANITVFRARWAWPDRHTGTPANAADGCAGSPRGQLARELPEGVTVAFDGSLGTSFPNVPVAGYQACGSIAALTVRP